MDYTHIPRSAATHVGGSVTPPALSDIDCTVRVGAVIASIMERTIHIGAVTESILDHAIHIVAVFQRIRTVRFI